MKGRKHNDFYSYTVNGVYNNFPWPIPNADQKAKVEQTTPIFTM